MNAPTETPAAPAGQATPAAPAVASPPLQLAPAGPALELTRVYRGRTVEELIPKIEAELGGDAIVVRREKGLTGGFAGFFQRPFVEIEAKAGTPRVDRYDEAGGAPALPDALAGNAAAVVPHPLASGAPALPDALAGPPASAPQAPPPAGEATATPADQIAAEFEELTPASFIAAAGTPAHDPFTAALAHAESALPPAVVTRTAVSAQPAVEQQAPAQPQAPSHLQEPTQPQALAQQLAPIQPQTNTAAPATQAASHLPRGRARAKIEERLLGCGIDEALVRELIETAAAHTLPLMGARASLASAVQRTLAQRIPAAAPLPVGGAALALVGPGGSGKTTCAAALVQAYGARSTVCATHAPAAGAEERGEELRQAREEGLLVLDLPAVSPADRGAIRAQAALLGALAPERTVLTLPATLGTRAATQLLEALGPLAVDTLALTHADETDQLGVAVQTACAFGLAPAYLLSGSGGGAGGARGGLTQIDPAELAQRLLG
jgi:flagellar biosynthesis GTPase FlhF